MTGTCASLLVFDLENWCTFQSVHHGRSKTEAVRLWAAMTEHSGVRRLEDVMGVLHLGFSRETLREFSTEEALQALLSDVPPAADGPDAAAGRESPSTDVHRQ
jgi:hypothetical protein